MELLAQIGTINNPLNILSGRSDRDLTGAGGLVSFISSIVMLITVVGGLFVLFNFLFAGFGYISSQGDPKSIEEAKSRITMSVLGLIIIAGSIIFTGIVSQVLFGSPTTILRPQIFGPGS